MINLFLACNREMQPFPFFFVGYSLGGGGGDLGSGSGSKFNRAARVGSGWVRQSRVRAGFGSSVLSPCRPLLGPPLGDHLGELTSEIDGGFYYGVLR